MEKPSRSGSSVVDVEALWNELREIVGVDHLRMPVDEDRIDGILPLAVIEPKTEKEAAQVLKSATGAGLRVIPRGSGTKISWGNTPRQDFVILLTRLLHRLVEHAWGDMTATVEAGCTVTRFQKSLAEHGQRLALDPAWPDRATIGGILATNDSGPLRGRYGSLRDLIIGITLALPDGTLAKSGGKVVKNVAGYDLPKLATGSFGTLGIITQAIFRLHPVPNESRTLSFSTPDARTANNLILAIQDSPMVPTGLQVRASSSASPQVDVRFEGTATGCDAQIEQTVHAAGSLKRADPPADVWNQHGQIWSGSELSVVCKFTFLPSDLGLFLAELKTITDTLALTWQLVAQGVGVGFVRLDGPSSADYARASQLIRDVVEGRDGFLIVLRCPLEVKKNIDVWGSAGDVLTLMKRIKTQFDPQGTLSPGRFIGGI